MRRLHRTAALLAAISLLAPAASPAAAFDLEPGKGYGQVRVEVINYTAGDYVVGGHIGCDALGGFVDFQVDGGVSEPIELPVGATCWIKDFEGGDPGELGRWSHWEWNQDLVIVADQVATWDVTLEREYNGLAPRVDYDGWFPMEVLTVDRVWINRSGGISAEGLAWCPSVAPFVVDQVPYIGIDWAATQYVGRRTAIHGSYGSDIAKWCFDPDDPEAPVRWTSMHPAGTEAAIAWVYGVDGRFGSGTVIIEADALNDLSSIIQSWDPDLEGYDPDGCSPVFKANGAYDHNGDGFCHYAIWSGQVVTAAVKTTSLKGR